MISRFFLTCCVAACVSATSALAGTPITQDGTVSWAQNTAVPVFDASTSDKLVVIVSGEHNFPGNLTGECTSVTYNGQSLTEVIQQLPVDPAIGGHGQTHSSIWYLDNPGNYTGTDTVTVTCVGNNWVATAVSLSGTAAGAGGNGKVSGASSVEVTTTNYGALIMGATGMGGQGNTASPLPGVTAIAPSQAVTIDGLEIGSNWAGHSVGKATIDFPSLQTINFNTTKADVCTVAAVFEAANPPLPSGPVPVIYDVVPGVSVDLFWSNYLPNTGSDIWVDIWIGNTPTTLVKVVDGAVDTANRTSFLYQAPSPGTYHGRIDTYLDGAPTGTPLSGLPFTFEVSDEGLFGETWLGLTSLATIVTLQREGLDARPADQVQRVTSADFQGLPASAGARLRGLVTPDTTGDYAFAISGAENVTLWLSSDDSRFNKERIAYHLETTSSQEWDKYPSQQSGPISLQAGVSYYVEVQVMNSTGIGHASIGWRAPGASDFGLIPTSNLKSLPLDPADTNENSLPDAWEQSTGLDSSTLPGALAEFGDPDHDGITNFEEYLLSTDPLVETVRTDGLTRETWTDIGGTDIADLMEEAPEKFFGAPNEIIHVAGVDDNERGERYGSRYRGFLVAPESGVYRFWITGNDQAQLWLADGAIADPSTGSPLTNRFGKRVIAANNEVNGYGFSDQYEFDNNNEQRSAEITLTAGQAYYVEVLHKERDSRDHVSVAWETPSYSRGLIPASAFQGDRPGNNDLDHDNLPDDWETASGLSVSDNGLVDSGQGQYGDPDQDGLNNLLEFQNGTDPLVADTDGDGLNDGDEALFYNSDPTVSNNLASTPVPLPTLDQYTVSETTGVWTPNQDGSISSTSPRGKITYTFTVAPGESGLFEVILTGTPFGDLLRYEDFPVTFALNGAAPFAREILSSEWGGSATIRAITPWLVPGNYSLTVQLDNFEADRSLRIESLLVNRLGGQDLDGNGKPDWIEENAALANTMIHIPVQSRTSPVSIEGRTERLVSAGMHRQPRAASLSGPLSQMINKGSGKGAVQMDLIPSINDQFAAELELFPDVPTKVHVSFLDGFIAEKYSVEWISTNLFDFDGQTLHIRQNDSLLLDAWSGSQPDGGAFTVTLNGTLLQDGSASTTHTSGQPFESLFDTSGTHTLVASHDGQTATVALEVHCVDFGPAHSVRTYASRDWTPTQLDPFHKVEADERVSLVELSPPSGSQERSFTVSVSSAGDRKVLARLPDSVDGAPGGLLGHGLIQAFHLATLAQTSDATVVHQYDDGTWLMRSSLIGVNLPEDVYFQLTSVHQGTIFPNGDNIYFVDRDDFDENGVLTIYYECSGDSEPRLCHNVKVFVTAP